MDFLGKYAYVVRAGMRRVKFEWPLGSSVPSDVDQDSGGPHIFPTL